MPESNDEVSLAEFLAHPVATIGAAVSVVAGASFGTLEPLLATVWSHAGALFAVASVSSGTLATRLEWLPKQPLTMLAIAAALVFIANRLWRVYQGYQSERNQ